MAEFGPLHGLWEGGDRGEKFSQRLKSKLKGGLKWHWHVNVLRKVLLKDSIRRIEVL